MKPPAWQLALLESGCVVNRQCCCTAAACACCSFCVLRLQHAEASQLVQVLQLQQTAWW